MATYIAGTSGFGTDTATNTGCLADSQQGGDGQATASTSYSDPPANLSATADLASGVLTADADDADGGYASASEWDTFTFSGLPDGGAIVTATLSLNGTVTGIGTGSALLEEAGPGGTIGGDGSIDSSTFFNPSTGIPLVSSISLSFLATNGAADTVYAYIDADSGGSIVDLSDPPTLSLILPGGVTASSASGVFANFEPLSVPEPSSLALLAAALGLLAGLRAGAGRIIVR
ncbi:MAG TPA: PEP-CTERM sorting domain-containing protein [Stellaceae bacterium]|nr:PEP-CTERM sorting domain-containing protein [Stellaceae bacterium]HTV88601.1 PEP-CTERM sorting domain-containing protein [Stellaceae bacterium]